ncbi:hypothetical protein [Halanaeroarchaeum sulfurireducens]|uniref:Uncharacterized protein n=1 Tax=Halanaeroarchaeum sulfurireducens TaxID=1604004 RepID=A0A0F7P696_9EURY|nr:hypothetical protein [Halanaeroarchaeum sulfurireducens]AKH96661.1 hypothetical protein HLASF_0147 [Halanaeroarchaeum sulfurireducens]ALG81063.1 hypothetical protein HLASA_0147 [Halanaeroarchaeum sulfurireducens]
MDTTRLIELLAHYIVMLTLVFGVLALIRQTMGNLGFWIELAVAIVIAFAYRPIVIQLGVAPRAWTEEP